ncbi:MAG: outer membrane beta-barrel protein [Enterovibrio sp.]
MLKTQKLSLMITGIYVAMKKVLALALPLVMSTLTFANEGVIPQGKRGHTVHVGLSVQQGELSDISGDTVFSFGYDYTTSSGLIFGGFYMPELLSESYAYKWYPLSLTSSVFGTYAGYQFDNNLRLTGGLSFTYTELDFNRETTAETNVGFTIGLDYLVTEKFLIGSRLNTHDVDSFTGTTIGINVGYKF